MECGSKLGNDLNVAMLNPDGLIALGKISVEVARPLTSTETVEDIDERSGPGNMAVGPMVL